jgi:hypothetical protein
MSPNASYIHADPQRPSLPPSGVEFDVAGVNVLVAYTNAEMCQREAGVTIHVLMFVPIPVPVSRHE